MLFSVGLSRLSSISTAMMRPFAEARIFTSPPPLAPSTSTWSRLSCAFCSSFWAFCAISMIFSRSKSGMSGAFRMEGFQGRVGEGFHHRADVCLVKHCCANRLLGNLFLLLQRRLASLVGEAHRPAAAGDVFQRRGEVAA